MSEYRDHPDVLERRIAELQQENDELRRRVGEARRRAPVSPPVWRRWAFVSGAVLVVGALATFDAARSSNPLPAAPTAHHSDPVRPRTPPTTLLPEPTANDAKPLFDQAVSWSFDAKLSRVIGGSFEHVPLSDCALLVRSLPYSDGTVRINVFHVFCQADGKQVSLFLWETDHGPANSEVSAQEWREGARAGTTDLRLAARVTRRSPMEMSADVTLDTRGGAAIVKISRGGEPSELQFTDVQPGRDIKDVLLERNALKH